MNHTATPWKAAYGQYRVKDESGNLIARTDVEITNDREGCSRENAAFIVRAVNAHDALLSVCKKLIDAMHEGSERILRQDEIDAIVEARQAIAKAEGL